MIPIFIAFWVGLVVVALEGVKLGDSWRLVTCAFSSCWHRKLRQRR
jgi:hypothetical protein